MHQFDASESRLSQSSQTRHAFQNRVQLLPNTRHNFCVVSIRQRRLHSLTVSHLLHFIKRLKLRLFFILIILFSLIRLFNNRCQITSNPVYGYNFLLRVFKVTFMHYHFLFNRIFDDAVVVVFGFFYRELLFVYFDTLADLVIIFN